MATFNAKTLSTLHIGNGNKLLRNIDFFVYPEKENDRANIGVLDINKLGSVIGKNNIQKLIDFIDSIARDKTRDILNFIKEHAVKDFSYKDLIKRKISIYGNFEGQNELKEFLINASGNPIVPGSSLKGAIRTALASSLILMDKNKYKRQLEFNTLMSSSNQLERKILSQVFSNTEKVEPNKNIMRFLIVGDVEFKRKTIAVVLDIANYKFVEGKKWDIKTGQSSLVEALPEECDSEPFRISVNERLLEMNKNKGTITADSSYLNIDKILEIVNNHTKRLLDKEINFWNLPQQQQKSLPESLKGYVENLKNVRKELETLKKNEAIIRVGANTGWHSITGGWIEELLGIENWKTFYKKLNKGRNIDFFPKTRKIDQKGYAFGYLKLTKID